MSEKWDISQFHLNFIFPHLIDQVLNVVHSYFYVICLWYLIWYYKKRDNSSIIHTAQYKLIKKWVLTFASIYTIITINFTIAIATNWLYDDKSVFLDRASDILFLASFVYIGMNIIIMFSPHIMYGLPMDFTLKPEGSEGTKTSEPNQPLLQQDSFVIQDESKNGMIKNELQLFTPLYTTTIEASLQSCVDRKVYLSSDFKLSQISKELGIPAHHLTYYFNDIKKVSFSDWKNGLRIEYAKKQIRQGTTNTITLQALSIQCGFSSQSTFIRAFKNGTGNSPSHYLKSHS